MTVEPASPRPPVSHVIGLGIAKKTPVTNKDDTKVALPAAAAVFKQASNFICA
jgi:hypothetical protein